MGPPWIIKRRPSSPSCYSCFPIYYSLHQLTWTFSFPFVLVWNWIKNGSVVGRRKSRPVDNWKWASHHSIKDKRNLIELELDSYGTSVVSWGSGILDPSGPATRVWPIFGRLIFKTPIYKRLATSKEDLSLYLFLISLYELLPVDTFLEAKKKKPNVPLDMPGTPSGRLDRLFFLFFFQH